MDMFDVQVPKGRFRVISDTGREIGTIENQRHVKHRGKVIYEICGEQITDETHNGDLVGVFQEMEGRTLKGTLIFTLKPM